ncbi:MAG: ATP phosphoribosyltransferase [candidate division NC10 bacterium]|jgi:ATP phosphoribosyltransferase|nr:ATP phosphoribosyltransferase [candidate division NC10 bacterium]
MRRGQIAIALPKGRLLAEAIKLFEATGVQGLEGLAESRRLLCEDFTGAYRFLVLRPADIPTYVEYGATDMGVVGKDILLEQERDVYEPLDLKYGACRLVVARPTNLEDKGRPVGFSSLRVATKYPTLTERYFTEQGVQVEIIRLSGSIELAPLAGLCERIVDLVDTGRTLQENGLEEVEEITTATARLIVNRAALKTKYQQVRGMIERLTAAIQGGGA